MSVRLIHGDCLVELPKLAAAGERFRIQLMSQKRYVRNGFYLM